MNVRGSDSNVLHFRKLDSDILLEPSEPIDSYIDMIAPENVEFHVPLAGPFVRTLAYSIDLAVVVLYLCASSFGGFAFLIQLLAGKLGLVSLRLAEVIFYVFWYCNLLFALWFWNVVCETCWNGRTVGKAILGLRTLTADGRPINFGQALLRNVLRFADLTLGPFVVLIMGLNDRMARLGDIAAGTVVVVDRKKRVVAFDKFDEPVIQNILSKIPDDFEISSSLYKRLTLYVSRRKDLAPARRLEIASLLADHLSKKSGFNYRVEPDLFLCALYAHALGLERQIV